MNPERADYRQVILRDRLLAALARINPHIPDAALEQAVHALLTISEPQLAVRNRSFHRMLLSGVAVKFVEGELRDIFKGASKMSRELSKALRFP